jgi:hypothetical protein
MAKPDAKQAPKAKPKTPETPEAQLKRFRNAARESGVDLDADIDAVMRKLAGQKRTESKSKK